MKELLGDNTCSGGGTNTWNMKISLYYVMYIHCNFQFSMTQSRCQLHSYSEVELIGNQYVSVFKFQCVVSKRLQCILTNY